jgi:formate/nitrite transporter FocA (FNT family)
MVSNIRCFIVSIKIIRWGLILPLLVGLPVGMTSRSIDTPHAMIGAWAGLAVLSFLGLATFVMMIIYSHFHPGIDSSSSMLYISKFAKTSRKALLATLVLSIPVSWFISCAVWGSTEEAVANFFMCIIYVFVLGGAIGIVLSIFSVSEIIISDGKIGGTKKTLTWLSVSLVLVVIPVVLFVGFISDF